MHTETQVLTGKGTLSKAMFLHVMLTQDNDCFSLRAPRDMKYKTYFRARPFPPVQLLNRAPYKVFLFIVEVGLVIPASTIISTHHDRVLDPR